MNKSLLEWGCEASRRNSRREDLTRARERERGEKKCRQSFSEITSNSLFSVFYLFTRFGVFASLSSSMRFLYFGLPAVLADTSRTTLLHRVFYYICSAAAYCAPNKFEMRVKRENEKKILPTKNGTSEKLHKTLGEHETELHLATFYHILKFNLVAECCRNANEMTQRIVLVARVGLPQPHCCLRTLLISDCFGTAITPLQLHCHF